MPGRIHKRTQLFERINLYGPMEDSHKWMGWCYDQGYRIIRCGPKVTSWPKTDMSRFHFIAEKEMLEELGGNDGE